MRGLMPVAALLLLAMLTVACGASEDAARTAAETVTESAPPAAEDETEASAGMTFDPRPGEILLGFVDAAAEGDARGLWGLLSSGSQERLGPTLEEFTDRFVAGFRDGLGTFHGTNPEVVVSGIDTRGWGVAAIAGDRVRDGQQEFATYGAALHLEDGVWRLELGAPIELRHLTGGSADTLEVEVSADAPIEAAGLWVDGTPLRAVREGAAERFVIHAERLQLGTERHVAVTFARTADAAAAGAFSLSAPAVTTPENETT